MPEPALIAYQVVVAHQVVVTFQARAHSFGVDWLWHCSVCYLVLIILPHDDQHSSS